jgi:ribosomal protein L11 methyltransferase
MSTEPSASKPLYLWSKISSTRWEEEWEERLRFLPTGAVVFLSHPASRALRIRAYTDARTAKRLARYFGGSTKKLAPSEWNRELDRELRPLSVRGRLTIFSEKSAWERFRQEHPERRALFIPASMAFGTGSHPTTAGCLRLLADATRTWTAGRWRQADLGCGSGILGLAGLRLGAETVEFLDYDPVCARETRRNARLNRLKIPPVQVAEVGAWHPETPFDLITANLFSDTLIAAAPSLSQGLRPGGTLIFSGVLRAQLPEVLTALRQHHLLLRRHNDRGKWVFGLAEKSKNRTQRH